MPYSKEGDKFGCAVTVAWSNLNLRVPADFKLKQGWFQASEVKHVCSAHCAVL